MVTVVIPCYNAEKYLNKCVASLIDQTYKHFKVVFVDDNSTDNTYQLLRRLESDSSLNIQVLHNFINSGPAISRNIGIKTADTEYITFCDSDDWYEPDYLEKMINLLEKNDADISFCGYNVVDERGNRHPRPVYGRSGLINRDDAFSLDADSLCMLMVKTGIMKATLLPNLRNGEDVAIVPLLMAKSQRFVVTNKCLYNYFRRSDSASEVPTVQVVDSLLSSFQFTKSYFPAEFNYELEYLGIKNVLYSAIITLFSIGYDRARAEHILSDFEKDFPSWRSNVYIKKMRLYKRIIITMVAERNFMGVRFVALIRKILLK